MNVDVPTAQLTALLLGSVRAAAWLVTSPPFNTKLLPVTVKALLSVAIALPVAPRLAPTVPDLADIGFVVSLVEQVLIGTALGFVTAVLFAAVQAAGSLIDLFGGFSVAFAFDPLSQQGSSVFGRIYNLFATTLLFVTDGHQIVLQGFARSYRALPLDGNLQLARLGDVLTDGLAQMFVAALQIAGPLIAVLFVADIGLGLLTRAAPALNALALGFPIKIAITLATVGTAIALLPKQVAGIVDRAVDAVLRVLGG
jgi:flagellar biosynthetic protein FliR